MQRPVLPLEDENDPLTRKPPEPVEIIHEQHVVPAQKVQARRKAWSLGFRAGGTIPGIRCETYPPSQRDTPVSHQARRQPNRG